jgi:hypothetical protein
VITTTPSKEKSLTKIALQDPSDQGKGKEASKTWEEACKKVV